jgi:hypothetical protein
MHFNLLIGLGFIIFTACSGHVDQSPAIACNTVAHLQQEKELIHPAGNTISTRFLTPEGFARIDAKENSFQEFLHTLPLKPHNTKVKLYDGRIKEDHGVYCAVADLGIGTKDLHQCADAVIRLRAEYLYEQEQYEKIHFNFTNGFRAEYSEWMKGKRIRVDGNNVRWIQSVRPSNSYGDFWKYMETIFTYAGTLSLSGELQPAVVEDIRTGDVFIRGGSPGHAVIVVDMAESEQGKKIFLLAQSYMPAQEIQVLKNPDNEELSPWYSADFGELLHTPEWTFRKTDLKRFPEE